jgi:hypothetical protein
VQKKSSQSKQAIAPPVADAVGIVGDIAEQLHMGVRRLSSARRNTILNQQKKKKKKSEVDSDDDEEEEEDDPDDSLSLRSAAGSSLPLFVVDLLVPLLLLPPLAPCGLLPRTFNRKRRRRREHPQATLPSSCTQ